MNTKGTAHPYTLPRKPRCDVLCRNVATGDIVRCAMWEGHTPSDQHEEIKPVILAMAEAIAMQSNTDLGNMSINVITLMARARMYYRYMVYENDSNTEEHTT